MRNSRRIGNQKLQGTVTGWTLMPGNSWGNSVAFVPNINALPVPNIPWGCALKN